MWWATLLHHFSFKSCDWEHEKLCNRDHNNKWVECDIQWHACSHSVELGCKRFRLNPNHSSVAKCTNDARGIYNTHADYSVSRTDASSQPKPQNDPQNVMPPVLLLQKRILSVKHWEGHTELCKPLPAGLIKTTQLNRGRGGRLLAPRPQRARGHPVLNIPLDSKTGLGWIIAP